MWSHFPPSCLAEGALEAIDDAAGLIAWTYMDPLIGPNVFAISAQSKTQQANVSTSSNLDIFPPF